MNADAAKLLVPRLSFDAFEHLYKQDKALALIYLQLFREQVAPIFEEWRNPHRVKCAYGGRGAGAKSRSAGSLLLQFAERPAYFGNSLRVLCVRDVQKSIKESSWRLLKDELARLQYVGWEVTQNEIRNTKNGAYFVFNGLNDMTAGDLKSFESFDVMLAEEGAPISKDAWLTMLATFRKRGSEIWCLFNRDKPNDPCYDLFCRNPDPDWSILRCRPGALDNPWWNETTLQKEWDRLKASDPEEAQHVYEGAPRTQSARAVWSRNKVAAACDREASADGAEEIGCDVARYGRDSTVAWKHKGMQIIDKRSVNGFDTVAVSGMLWDLANRSPVVPIKVDAGYNPGVIDVLKSFGANVVEVNFGGIAVNKDKYVNAAAEMMFDLPIDMIGIPSQFYTVALEEDLSERFYFYDSAGRKRLEPKDSSTDDSKAAFKGRHGGRSPDEGDALCLCFYDVTPKWSLL